ncbi:MAG: RNA 2',3'-cyclic phosphodiesterase [Deltaproteobacteria bacterium]|nr:RNA 2',3'-cyclic phosphodiesterase [Deltaproteobacteria bacterium]
MIRAFVGVRIDPEVVERILEIRFKLPESGAGIRWVRKENLHFTLKFLGPVEENRIAPIAQSLGDNLKAIPRFEISAKGIGVFPGIKRARILWVGLEGEGLRPLAMTVERALEPLGFARESRAFSPHLTIGRWRNFDGSPERLGEEIDRWKNHLMGKTQVNEVVLFKSVLKSAGADYSPLEVFSLADPGTHL